MLKYPQLEWNKLLIGPIISYNSYPSLALTRINFMGVLGGYCDIFDYVKHDFLL